MGLRRIVPLTLAPRLLQKPPDPVPACVHVLGSADVVLAVQRPPKPFQGLALYPVIAEESQGFDDIALRPANPKRHLGSFIDYCESASKVHLPRLALVLISFYIDAMERCRLCTTNDVEGLIEEIAQELWASFPKDVAGTWADAEGYWQHVMRTHARVIVGLLHKH